MDDVDVGVEAADAVVGTLFPTSASAFGSKVGGLHCGLRVAGIHSTSSFGERVLVSSSSSLDAGCSLSAACPAGLALAATPFDAPPAVRDGDVFGAAASPAPAVPTPCAPGAGMEPAEASVGASAGGAGGPRLGVPDEFFLAPFVGAAAGVSRASLAFVLTRAPDTGGEAAGVDALLAVSAPEGNATGAASTSGHTGSSSVPSWGAAAPAATPAATPTGPAGDDNDRAALGRVSDRCSARCPGSHHRASVSMLISYTRGRGAIGTSGETAVTAASSTTTTWKHLVHELVRAPMLRAGLSTLTLGRAVPQSAGLSRRRVTGGATNVQPSPAPPRSRPADPYGRPKPRQR